MIADLVTGLLSDQVSINGIVFDAYLEMTQNDTVTVTSHPVQTGANISDHAYVNPKEFEYLIGVTNSSLGKSAVTFGVSLFGIGEDRSVSARNMLDGLMRLRKPVTLHNKYGDFTVVITSISTDDDYTTNDCMKARVHMKEIIIANTISYKTDVSSYIMDENNMGKQPSSRITQTSQIRELEKSIGIGV